jgi:hypothetical protein
MKFLAFSQTKLGSSLLPAHGSGGVRATINIKVPQKNRAKPEKQKGKKEGGLWEGIFALLRLEIERFRFSLIKRNTKQKNFLFLLKSALPASGGSRSASGEEATNAEHTIWLPGSDSKAKSLLLFYS